MKKVLLGLVIFSVNSNASTQMCLAHYSQENLKTQILQASDIPASQIALKAVVGQLSPTISEYQFAKKTYDLTVPKKMDKAELARLEKISQEKMSPETAEYAIKKLLKSGFLLGPLHEALYGRAAQTYTTFESYAEYAHAGVFRAEYAYDLEINKDREKLTALSRRLYSKENIDLEFQKKLTADIFEKMNLSCDFDINSKSHQIMTAEKFSLMPYSEKLDYITSFFATQTKEPGDWIKENLLISPAQAINSMSALLEVRDLPGSKSFLMSVFHNSLKEVNNNLLTKTHGKYSKILTSTNLASVAGAATGGLAMFTSVADPLITSLGIPSSGHNIGFAGAAILAATYGLNYNHDKIYVASSRAVKNNWIKIKNIYKTRSVKSKTIKSLNDETNDPIAKELAKDPNADDALDLDFSYIKYDIQKDIQNTLDIPTWGNEFSKGISNISLRINLILEKYQILVSEMDPLLKKALAENNTSNLNLKLSAINNDITKMKFFELLVDLQSIKTDTLTLSLFLDEYLKQANSHKNVITSTNAAYFLEDKLGHFQREIEILRGTSSGIQEIQTQLTQNITTLNTVYHAQNIDVITNVKERLKIK